MITVTRSGPESGAQDVAVQRVAGQDFKPRGRYVGPWVPEVVAASKDLSLGAKLTYGALADCGDRAFPSYKALGARIGVGRTMAVQYRRELRQAGLIRIETQGRGPRVLVPSY